VAPSFGLYYPDFRFFVFGGYVVPPGQLSRKESMGRWQDLDIVRDTRQVFFIYFSIKSIPIELVLIAQPGTVPTETRANTVKMGIEIGK
jgi:hypothetical protein